MNGEPSHTDARERVLLAAERLFAQRGFAAVTLRDIAAEVGIRHASLYHHVPGGKEELYVEVTERNFARHRQGIVEAIAGASSDVRACLYAVAGWLVSQPPMDLLRMVHADIPSLNPEHAQRISSLAFNSIIQPVARVLEDAQHRNEIGKLNVLLIAGAIITMIEGLHAVPPQAIETNLETMAHEVIDALLDGMLTRSGIAGATL
jgi:AcrR family transcriptional regulator